MAKFRVPLWKKPQAFTTVDTEATKGATIGRDVYNADGSLYVPTTAAAAAPVASRTLWSLISLIPANIVALAALATDGWIRRDGAAITAQELEATDVAIADAGGYFTGADVEAALQELGAGGGGGGGSGAMTLVGTATVAGSADTTIPLSSLDLDTAGEYEIRFALKNATASVTTCSLFFNGDTTTGNYWRQNTTANSGISGSRANDAALCSMVASGYATGKINIIKSMEGKPTALSFYVRSGGSSILTQHTGMEYQTTGNVTSITISSSVASAFAVGSYFKVFKVN